MQNDDKIKELLSGTREKAGENLKYRIMQQIETEKALAKKKERKVNPLSSVWSMLSVFGVMYAIVAVLVLLVYFNAGVDALASPMFFLPVLLISAVCMTFMGVILYDDRRRSKMKKGE